MTVDFCVDGDRCTHHLWGRDTVTGRLRREPPPLQEPGCGSRGVPVLEQIRRQLRESQVNPCADIDPLPLAHREDCGTHEGYMCTCRVTEPTTADAVRLHLAGDHTHCQHGWCYATPKNRAK